MPSDSVGIKIRVKQKKSGCNIRDVFNSIVEKSE